MPAMKVTPDAAMRARDVSRPRAEQLRWAEEAEAGVTATTDVVIESHGAVESGVAVETGVTVELGVAVESGVAAEAGHWSERLAMAGAPAEMDIPDSESPGSEDRPADSARVGGTRRRRVRSFRSSSRRGRPSR